MRKINNEWLIERIEKMLEEIDSLIMESYLLTNSKRDIIIGNIEMIQEKLYELKLEK